jgi:hypothetical protein
VTLVKKTGVTKKKRNRKREPEKAYVRNINGTFVLFTKFAGYRGTRAILYSGKLDMVWSKPLAAAKCLAEIIRTNPSAGWRLLRQVVEWRRNEKGYLPKMMQKLGEYLEDQDQVFDKKDYQIIDIVQQHPDFTIKEITFELSKQYPEQKWTEQKLKTLARRVQRLLENFQ